MLVIGWMLVAFLILWLEGEKAKDRKNKENRK